MRRTLSTKIAEHQQMKGDGGDDAASDRFSHSDLIPVLTVRLCFCHHRSGNCQSASSRLTTTDIPDTSTLSQSHQMVRYVLQAVKMVSQCFGSCLMESTCTLWRPVMS